METPNNSPISNKTYLVEDSETLEFSQQVELTLEETLNDWQYDTALSLEMLALQSPHGSIPSYIFNQQESLNDVKEDTETNESHENENLSLKSEINSKKLLSSPECNSLSLSPEYNDVSSSECHFNFPTQSKSMNWKLKPIYHLTPHENVVASSPSISNKGKENRKGFKMQMMTESHENNSDLLGLVGKSTSQTSNRKKRFNRVEKISNNQTSHSCKKKSPKHGGIYSLLLRKGVETQENASQAILVGEDTPTKLYGKQYVKSPAKPTTSYSKEVKKNYQHGSIYKMLLETKKV